MIFARPKGFLNPGPMYLHACVLAWWMLVDHFQPLADPTPPPTLPSLMLGLRHLFASQLVNREQAAILGKASTNNNRVNVAKMHDMEKYK